MTTRKALGRERALQLIHDHELDFLDLCEIVLAYSERIDGSVEWDGLRVVVKIRQKAAAKRIATAREAEWKKTHG